MSVIYSEELSIANCSNMLENLNYLRTNSQILSNKIIDFTSNIDNYLVGDVASVVKRKWELLLDALKKQDMICENLISNIKAANNIMIGYVENYEFIDNDKEEEIFSILCRIDSIIDCLNNYDKEMQKGEKYSQYYNIQELILQRDKLQRYYEKIKELAGYDNLAYAKITDVIEDIANYTKAIDQVNSGIRSTFLHPGNRDILYYSQTGYFKDGIRYEWESKWKSADGNRIHKGGCGPTSCAMAFGTILHDSSINPETIANLMYEENLTNKDEFVKPLSENFGLNCEKAYYDGDAIEAVIKAGGGFMRVSPVERFNGDSHYITITDVVYKDDKRYFVVCDPYPENENMPGEPSVISEQEFLSSYRGINYYITPPGVEMQLDPTNTRIISVNNVEPNN